MRYPLIIFDLDGTLADSLPCFLEVMEEITQQFGLRAVPREELPALRQLGAREVLQRVGLPWWKLPRVARAVHASMGRRIAEVALFPGIADALRELHQRGHQLALVTSNVESNARRILGAPLAELFSAFECGAKLFGKRSRFERVLRRCRQPREAALCIGDEIRDAEAARAARLAFGAVTWGFTEATALLKYKPAHIFRTPAELADLEPIAVA